MALTEAQKAANYAKRKKRGKKGRGGKVILQERDYCVLLTVFDLHYATTELLRLLHAPEITKGTFSERIGKLVDHPNDYLDYSPQNEDNPGKHRAPLVVQITPEGIKALIAAGYITSEQADWRRSFLIGKPQDFWHDLQVSNIVGSIMLALKGDPTKRFVTPWAVAEIAARNSLFIRMYEGHTVKADYIFAIGHAVDGDEEEYRYFWLEHDRGKEQFSPKANGSSLGGKLNDLELVLQRKLYRDLGIPNINILTSITKPGRVTRALEHVATFTTKKRFAFKAINITSTDQKVPLPIPDLVMEPWTCVGNLAPLPIDTLF